MDTTRMVPDTTLIGNAVAWPVYLKLRKTHPLPVQKTLQEEMREAAGTKADAEIGRAHV